MRAQTERLRLEYRDSIARARELVEASPPEALRRKPADGSWCAAECLDHLNLTMHDYLRRIEEAVRSASVRPPRREESLSLLGRFVIGSLEPPPRRRLTAAATLMPASQIPRTDILLSRFDQVRQQAIRMIEETDAIDRMRIKVTLADWDWFRLTLFDALCVLAAHDRRHLWQAEHAARV